MGVSSKPKAVEFFSIKEGSSLFRRRMGPVLAGPYLVVSLDPGRGLSAKCFLHFSTDTLES